ncbi:MAG: methyltransferase domain-containing protein [Kofleriaceae bacterium]|nr:methyltransferase domain-containing protein [Myxococcales bacterium]MCB9564665.1 methyltransferase domain-containing protein [Kofleriaceae bacterium]
MSTSPLVSLAIAVAPLVAVGCGGGATGAPTTAGPATPVEAAPDPAHHGHHGHHGADMPHRFEDADAWAKVFDDPARDAWQRPDEVVALLALAPGMVVADVGAGTGYFEGRIAAAVGPDGEVIATDVEPDMVRYLGERAAHDGWTNVRALQVEPGDPGLAPASVDRVLIVDVWHHLDDRAGYAARLATALRPGGWVAVVDFTGDAERGPPRDHRLAPEAIIADLTAGGLVAELATETLPDQYVVIGRLPDGR